MNRSKEEEPFLSLHEQHPPAGPHHAGRPGGRQGEPPRWFGEQIKSMRALVRLERNEISDRAILCALRRPDHFPALILLRDLKIGRALVPGGLFEADAILPRHQRRPLQRLHPRMLSQWRGQKLIELFALHLLAGGKERDQGLHHLQVPLHLLLQQPDAIRAIEEKLRFVSRLLLSAHQHKSQRRHQRRENQRGGHDEQVALSPVRRLLLQHRHELPVRIQQGGFGGYRGHKPDAKVIGRSEAGSAEGLNNGGRPGRRPGWSAAI